MHNRRIMGSVSLVRLDDTLRHVKASEVSRVAQIRMASESMVQTEAERKEIDTLRLPRA